jgi:anti-sigma-K factor RskA
MRYNDSELVSQLASEYVLGTLMGPARARFETLLEERADFREQTEHWERRLGEMLDGVVEVPPPPSAWETIAARVAPIAAVQQERGILERLGWWQRVAATACATLVIMVAVALWPRPPDSHTDSGYVVLVRDDAQRAVWVINTLPDLAELEVTAAAPLKVPLGKSCYLWVRPESSDQLFVLGLLPESGATRIQVPDELRQFLPGQLLVSMEDANAAQPVTPTDPMNMRSEWTRSLKGEF